MSQNDSISRSSQRQTPFELIGVFAKGAESFSAAQKVWMETVESTNWKWITLVEADSKLGSDFMTKVTRAKAPPDFAAACQEWMTGKMALTSQGCQMAFENGQNIMKACARIAGNGAVHI